MNEISISDWALGVLRSHAAAQALTYITHFGGSGLINMEDFNQMERWRRLTADLSGKLFEPMDPKKGKIRDFDETKIEIP